MQRIDHAHLGARRAACDNQRQDREFIHFPIAQCIKLRGSHDHRLGHLLANPLHPPRQDPHLDGNRLGRLGVIPRQHVHRNARLVTLPHRGLGLRPRGVIESDQSEEGHIPLHLLALHPLDPIDLSSGECENTQAHPREPLHLFPDLLFDMVIHLPLAIHPDKPGTNPQHALNSPFHHHHHPIFTIPFFTPFLTLATTCTMVIEPHNNTHPLNLTIKRKLSHLFPFRLLPGSQRQAVEMEPARKDLQGDFRGVTPRVPLEGGGLLEEGCEVC